MRGLVHVRKVAKQVQPEIYKFDFVETRRKISKSGLTMVLIKHPFSIFWPLSNLIYQNLIL